MIYGVMKKMADSINEKWPNENMASERKYIQNDNEEEK